jgi:membrane fusion protein (multidrug efflux system)
VPLILRLSACLGAGFLSLPLLLTPQPLAADPARGVPVEVAVVREQAIEHVVHLTGTVTSARSSRLSTATDGLVTVLQVDAGSRVTAGDVLLELDPELAQWQWESAQATVEEARLALSDARRRLDEARSLAPQQSIAETVVRDLAAEVAEDEAALHRAEAEAGFRKGILARHRLPAPFDGVVSAKLTELGEWVTPGQPVLELVATDDLRLDFQVAEDFLGDITTDTRVRFYLGADTATLYEGKIDTVVPVTDPGARTFLLRVRAVNATRHMLPGVSVRADLRLDTGRRGLSVPRDAILKFADGRAVVWMVRSADGESVVEERRVVTGLAFEGLVEVLEGLEEGARVVVEGNEALQDGQRVSVQQRPGR